MSFMIVLGVDGGATKTISVIANEKGDILGLGKGGPSNYLVVGIERAKGNLDKSIREATKKAKKTTKYGFDACCFGIAGLDAKESYDVFSKIINSLDLSTRNILVNDVVIAFNALNGGEPGIVVIAGTGSIAYGTDQNGNEARSGGWGWLIGDEGSAFDIGRKGLARASNACDGRGEDTTLVKIFEEHFQVIVKY